MIASDMRTSFQDAPILDAYDHVAPKQSLFEVNPAVHVLRGQARKDAVASMKMRWDIPDAAPTERLNRVLWRQVRGEKAPYPGAKHAAFAPFAIDIDDDDR